MNEETRQDIRKLLKTFGVEADETISAYLEAHPGEAPLLVRIRLSATTAGREEGDDPLDVIIEGEIRR